MKKEELRLWALSQKQVFDHFKTTPQGLTLEEAQSRFKTFGPNELPPQQRRGIHIYLAQFKNPLLFVLLIAAAISFFLAEAVDATVICAIVLLNSVLGFLQEYRAERAVRELAKYITVTAHALRDGELAPIDARELVPGDIVHLSIGDIVPADIRLTSVQDLCTDESSLTGESLPVLKKITTVRKTHSLPHYLHNIAFMGTSVASGTGYGIVIATGQNTFFGKTASAIKQSPPTDFEKNITAFGNFLLKIITAMTLFIFIGNAILGKGLFDSFLFAIALAVGITPEVLPIIITATLSHGALRMAKEKVVTKRLISVEDLGNIDTLCCDKTGTLTEGKISLVNAIDLHGKTSDQTLLFGLLCNASEGRKLTGNPIDAALHESKRAAVLSRAISTYTIVSRSPFDFHRKRMSILARQSKQTLLIAKGAPESIIATCTSAIWNGRKTSLTPKLKKTITELITKHERTGHRVIAVATKQTTNPAEKNLTLTGLLLLSDPPKKDVKESLATLQKLGIAINILTGDSPIVTRKICTDVGITIKNNTIITGDELETMNDQEIAQTASAYNVYARLTPEQKHRLVRTLCEHGHIVGFLGDGINDAPALKAADVGISVDTGAGIAKEAADIILLKKSLRVLAHGIIEGRKTFGNITKYILNTTSANYGNMFTVAISSLFLPFIPLLPSQILLVNLITDAPLLTIATDNVDEELLKKPKRWSIGLISHFMTTFGLISTAFDLLLISPLIILLHVHPELLRTSWFVLSALSEILITFSLRTTKPFYKSLPSTLLVIMSTLMILFTLFIPHTQLGAAYFSFVPLTPPIIPLLIGILVIAQFITAELVKRWFFKKVPL